MLKQVKNTVFCLIALMLCVVLVAEAYAQEHRLQIRVGILPILQELPIVVSKKEAVVALKNVDVRIEIFKSWTALEAAYRTGMIDAAGITVTKALKMAIDNIPLSIVLFLHRNGSSLVMNTDTSKEGLMNTVIGTGGSDTGDLILLYRFLQKKDIKVGVDSRYILIPLERSTNLVNEGEINGFILPEPYPAIAKAQGLVKSYVLDKDISPRQPDVILIVNPKIVAKNRAAVQEWISSIVKSGAFIEEDKNKTGGKQTALIQADFFKFSEKIIKQVLTSSKDAILFNDMRVNKKELEDIIKDALTLEIISAGVDLSKLIDNSFGQ